MENQQLFGDQNKVEDEVEGFLKKLISKVDNASLSLVLLELLNEEETERLNPSSLDCKYVAGLLIRRINLPECKESLPDLLSAIVKQLEKVDGEKFNEEYALVSKLKKSNVEKRGSNNRLCNQSSGQSMQNTAGIKAIEEDNIVYVNTQEKEGENHQKAANSSGRESVEAGINPEAKTKEPLPSDCYKFVGVGYNGTPPFGFEERQKCRNHYWVKYDCHWCNQTMPQHQWNAHLESCEPRLRALCLPLPTPSTEEKAEKHVVNYDRSAILLQCGDIEPNPGPGYEAKFVRPLLKCHKCPICLYAIRNPIKTDCGHLFCRECLVFWRSAFMRTTCGPICPLDKEEITLEGTFPDNACEEEILNLEVYCNYVAGGCPWFGHLKDLEAHLKSCKHREIQCIPCGQYIQAATLKTHQDMECPMRPERCVHCNQEVPSQQMEDHLKKVCPDVLHPCPNSYNPSLKFKLPESLRKNLPAHMGQYQVYHAQMQCESFLEMKTQMDKSAAAMQHLMERVGSLESRTNAIEQPQDTIEQRVKSLDERRERPLERYEGKIEALEKQATQTNSMLTQLTRQPAASRHLQGMGPPVAGDTLVSIMDTLQRRVVEVEHGIDRALSSCLDQELRIQLLERATYNGVLIWKIDEFERSCKEAIDGVTMSLYFTPFYISRSYKMCCRIYLNGDGLGKGTHLSFFFAIMQEPFNGLFEWHFKQKVINQQQTNSFRTDPQSFSFHRPARHKLNIASGCLMFIQLRWACQG